MSKSPVTKALSLLLALLMLLSSAALCISAVSSAPQTTSASNDTLDLSTYSLVRPDSASYNLLIAAATLRAHIEQYTGVKIELKSDAESETANEILIGNTNRSAASAIYSATKGDNWIVTQVGSKVVLAAGESCNIVNATNWFVENCIRKNSTAMTIGEGYATNNATRSYEVSGFTIGSYKVSAPKITYISSDNVAYKEAAILLADNIRRMSGITPAVTAYSDSASGQILIASQEKGGSYSAVSAGAMQYAITKRNNNIIIVSNDEMGAEMGAQEIIRAMKASTGGVIDLSSFVNASPYNYTYSHNLDLDYGAEYRIMTYNVLRYDTSLNTTDNPNKSTNDRYDEAYNTVLFYNPDVVGFQEYCVNYHANMRPELEKNGYTFVAPKPELYSNSDNTCSGNTGGTYDITSNYTPIAYKTDKFTLLDSGSKRIIPCRPHKTGTIFGWNDYTNNYQGTYGWPGYTVTWAVLKDKTTGDVFAVTSLHNLTGQTDDNAKNKIDSLAIVKNIVDEKITNVYNCPVFMVGDYNSFETMADIQSFANEANNIYDSRYLAEYGYSVGNSTILPGKISCSGTTASNIDQLFVRGNARILRHRYAHSYVAAYSSDHKPVFIDVVIGEPFSRKENASIFDEVTGSMKVNGFAPVENVIGDIFPDNGPLAITEIAPCTTAMGYDFVEIMNVSDTPVDLHDYYIHRDTRSHANKTQYSVTLIQAVLFQSGEQPTASVKHRLADSSMMLAPGEVAIIWLTDNSDSIQGFKDKWGISNANVKVSKVKIDNLHTISKLYGNPPNTIDYKDQSGAKGSYLSQNYKVSYSLTIAHEDFSCGLANYTLYHTKNADAFNVESQKILKSMASCVVAVLSDVSCCGTSTDNKSAIFNSFYTETEMQAAIDNMSTAPALNTSASSFYKTLETLDPSAPFALVTQTHNSSTSCMPSCTFDQTPTPGTVENQSFTTMKGKLAISEINYAPADVRFEYIEVVNTGTAAVNLKDYYVYRFAFSNSNKYLYAGIRQMFGVGGYIDSSTGLPTYTNNAKLVKISMKNIDQYVLPQQVAVIWFASSDSQNLTVSDFKNYWEGRGADMANVIVVKLPVYDTNGNNIYPANDQKEADGTTETITGPNKNAGSSFLPDKQAGFAISLINKSFADTDTIEPATLTPTKTRSRHAAADCSALVILTSSDSGDKSFEYYDFVDKTKLKNALDSFTFPTSANLTAAKSVKVNIDEVSDGLVVAKRTVSTKENIWAFCTMSTAGDQSTASEAIAFPNQPEKTNATPGKLLDGQFNYTTESSVVVEGVQTKKNANNTADLRFVASLKGSYLNYRSAGFEFTLNGQTVSVNCKHVYKTLNSNAGSISPEEYGADYFFCYSLKNVSAGTYTFSIRSWSLEDGASEKIYSQAKTVTFVVASNGSVTIQ